MDPTSINTLSNSFIGFLVPFIVQFIRHHWIPWSGKAAMWLSFTISTACVMVAYVETAGTPTVEGALGNIGLAFTLSQVVFTHVEDALKKNLPTPSSSDPPAGNGA
jgi:hypothetical protein